MKLFLDNSVRGEGPRRSPIQPIRRAFAVLLLWTIAAGHSASASQDTAILARQNIVPWEVHWYQDGVELEPEARARMLAARGVKRHALPYSGADSAKLAAEITGFQRHGVEIVAVYFWLRTERPGEDPNVRAAFETFERLRIRPQIWVSQSDAFLPKTSEEWKQQLAEMGFDLPTGYDVGKAVEAAFSSDTAFTDQQKEKFFKAFHRLYSEEAKLPKTPQAQARRLEQEAARIASLARLASRYGLDVELYNHNGWLGLIDNQLAIIERLGHEGIRNVGMVYTFWHARDSMHDDVRIFDEMWAKIMPHVNAVGISGVRGEMESLYPSQGEDELGMMRVVQKSGWKGPVAVLCLNFSVDPDTVLRDVLRGVEWISSELAEPGAGGARPLSRVIGTGGTHPVK